MKTFIIITGKTSMWMPDNFTRFDTPGKRLVFEVKGWAGPMAVVEYGVYGLCTVDTRDKDHVEVVTTD
jgi:hypothetical protein